MLLFLFRTLSSLNFISFPSMLLLSLNHINNYILSRNIDSMVDLVCLFYLLSMSASSDVLFCVSLLVLLYLLVSFVVSMLTYHCPVSLLLLLIQLLLLYLESVCHWFIVIIIIFVFIVCLLHAKHGSDTSPKFVIPHRLREGNVTEHTRS